MKNPFREIDGCGCLILWLAALPLILVIIMAIATIIIVQIGTSQP